jgi:hypothetical protein
MCIIIAKPAGQKFNMVELEKSVENAKKHNSHGGGYAIKREGETTIKLIKGFIYPEIMLEHLELEDIKLNDEVMIHLRFSTSGLTNTANCHPFIVSTDIDEIVQDDVVTNKPVIAHNGTFINYSDAKSVHSDTVHFVKDFLAIDGTLTDIYNICCVDQDFIEASLGNNRLCIMFPDEREMLLLGSWNVPEGKAKTSFFYSNYYYCNPYNGYVKPVANVSHVNYGRGHYPTVSGRGHDAWEDWYD